MSIESLSEEQLLITLETELYNRSFFAFIKDAAQVLEPQTKFDWIWVHEFLANTLQAELERLINGEEKTKDILLNLPFRAGKSLILSILFPAYILSRQPTLTIGCVSATQDLATKFSSKVKQLLTSDWYQQHYGNKVRISNDQRAKADFMVDGGGRMSAFGIHTAKILGSGFDLLLIDDAQATINVTPVGLLNTINSYRDAVQSRIRDPKTSVRILCQQRVHEGDLSGWITANIGEKFTHICIPARLTKDLKPTYLATNYTNGLMWENRFSNQVLDDFKLTMRGNQFSGQLMQSPAPEEGSLIMRSWFKTVKLSSILTLNLQWNLVLDTATSEKTTNDPTAFLLVAKSGNNLIIRKAARKWLQFYELLEEIKEWKRIYNIHRIYVEDKSSGTQILQELKRATKYNVLALSPMGKDKVQRVMAAQPVLQSQRVILVEDDTWNEMLLSESAAFPYSAHDDLVDTLTYAVSEFMQKSGGTVFK